MSAVRRVLVGRVESLILRDHDEREAVLVTLGGRRLAVSPSGVRPVRP
jgi:hypothetical protein